MSGLFVMSDDAIVADMEKRLGDIEETIVELQTSSPAPVTSSDEIQAAMQENRSRQDRIEELNQEWIKLRKEYVIFRASVLIDRFHSYPQYAKTLSGGTGQVESGG